MPYLCWCLWLGQGCLNQSYCLLLLAQCPLLPFPCCLGVGDLLLCRSPSVNIYVFPLKYIFFGENLPKLLWRNIPPELTLTQFLFFSYFPSPHPKGMVMSCSRPCSWPLLVSRSCSTCPLLSPLSLFWERCRALGSLGVCSERPQCNRGHPYSSPDAAVQFLERVGTDLGLACQKVEVSKPGSSFSLSTHPSI